MVAPIRRRVQEPRGHRLDETWGFVPLGSEPLIWLRRGWRHEHGHGWNSAWLFGGGEFDGSRFLHLPPYLGFTRRLADGDEQRGERHRSMLQPFYSFERKAEDDVFFAMLGGLLGSYERAGRWRQLKVLFVPVRRWSR